MDLQFESSGAFLCLHENILAKKTTTKNIPLPKFFHFGKVVVTQNNRLYYNSVLQLCQSKKTLAKASNATKKTKKNTAKNIPLPKFFHFGKGGATCKRVCL